MFHRALDHSQIDANGQVDIRPTALAMSRKKMYATYPDGLRSLRKMFRHRSNEWAEITCNVFVKKQKEDDHHEF